ncbi:unnamed protein product [Prunus armeniaca]
MVQVLPTFGTLTKLALPSSSHLNLEQATTLCQPCVLQGTFIRLRLSTAIPSWHLWVSPTYFVISPSHQRVFEAKLYNTLALHNSPSHHKSSLNKGLAPSAQHLLPTEFATTFSSMSWFECKPIFNPLTKLTLSSSPHHELNKQHHFITSQNPYLPNFPALSARIRKLGNRAAKPIIIPYLRVILLDVFSQLQGKLLDTFSRPLSITGNDLLPKFLHHQSLLGGTPSFEYKPPFELISFDTICHGMSEKRSAAEVKHTFRHSKHTRAAYDPFISWSTFAHRHDIHDSHNSVKGSSSSVVSHRHHAPWLDNESH